MFLPIDDCALYWLSAHFWYQSLSDIKIINKSRYDFKNELKYKQID
jgi:hypothetical protein